MKLLITLVLILTVFSCKKKDEIVSIGTEMSLCFGNKGIVLDNENQLEIEFIKLIEDSRCPEGMQCIWAGRAVVELRINSKDVIRLGIGDLQSNTTDPYFNMVEYGNYNITLLSVNYNKKRQIGKEEKYDIVIQVDRK